MDPLNQMSHLHEKEVTDPLELDKPGYYTPIIEEAFMGCYYEVLLDGRWMLWSHINNDTPAGSYIDLIGKNAVRMKWLQAKDIIELGFTKIMPQLPMYQRGSYIITTYRLLDPTYSRIKLSLHGVVVFEGQVKNKSELARLLKINQVDFVGFYK